MALVQTHAVPESVTCDQLLLELANSGVASSWMTAAERKSDFCPLTNDILYLALKGELWGVYCKDMGKQDRR